MQQNIHRLLTYAQIFEKKKAKLLSLRKLAVQEYKFKTIVPEKLQTIRETAVEPVFTETKFSEVNLTVNIRSRNAKNSLEMELFAQAQTRLCYRCLIGKVKRQGKNLPRLVSSKRCGLCMRLQTHN